MEFSKTSFGQTEDGQPVDRIQCANDRGLSMSLITYGAIMQSMHVPDRDGQVANINLGSDSLEGYEKCVAYFGATVGRFCNRIGGARFELGGNEYRLAENNPPNCLHGGNKGFSHAIWQAEEINQNDRVGVLFKHFSPDGDEGFPGNLSVSAEYLLTNDNELIIEFQATTDAMTVINLTNHNYWNLGGDKSGSILDHVLQVESDKFLTVDETLIPNGQFTDVADTELDFRQPTPIGERIDPLRDTPAKGYDHCFALRNRPGELVEAAKVSDPKSGRVMKISTTQPGIQLYTGNWMSGDQGSCGFAENEAFCLETQHFPDSPNVPSFPTTFLVPGQVFRQRTVHWFGTE